ncbi:MAG: methyltransferase [Odoribacter sp.]|nr:methyltransferase [Odoribacter sp.]
MDRNLEKYILEHSTPEDPLLADLYRQTHIRFVNPNMVSGHLQGRFLEMISKMVQPANILEIGTFTGYSAICLAKGLKPGGRLTTIDLDDELAKFAGSYFEKSGLSSLIDQMTGNALDIIPRLDILFDLVFIDGDKREYIDYYKAVFEKVRPGGFIIADNVLWGGKALDKNTIDPQARGIIEFNEMIRKETRIENVLLSVRDGLMVIRKK